MSKTGIAYKASLAAGQAMEHLESLNNSLSKGKVCLQVGDEFVVLQLGEGQQVELEICAAQKKDKNKLSLELSWLNMDPVSAGQPGIVISDQVPEKTPEPQPETQPGLEAAADPEPEQTSGPEPGPAEKAEAKKTVKAKTEASAKAKPAPAKKRGTTRAGANAASKGNTPHTS